MNSYENKRQEYFRRIRRLKRILRPLPRRANVHRYPVLKWFANTARKRSHLWSLRREDVIPSLYVGCIAGLLPMPAPQIPICFVMALLLRCNLVIAAALTLISNPLTFIPLYLAANWIGGLVLGTFWHPSLDDEITPEMIQVVAEQTGNGLPSLKFLQWYGETVLGGVVLGAILGAVLHASYQLIVNYSHRKKGDHHFGLLGRLRHHAKPESTESTPETDTEQGADGATSSTTPAADAEDEATATATATALAEPTTDTETDSPNRRTSDTPDQ